MGGLDRWMNYSYPKTRIIKINQIGRPMRGTSTISSATTFFTDYSPGSYSTVQDDRFHPEYEDPYNYYEKPPEVDEKRKALTPSPPPLPPPLKQNTLQKLVEDYTIAKYKRTNAKKKKFNTKYLTFLLIFILLLIIFCLIFIIIYLQSNNFNVLNFNNTNTNDGNENDTIIVHPGDDISTTILPSKLSSSNNNHIQKQVNVIISPSTLLAYIIAKKKICLFEVSTIQVEESIKDFEKEHIKSARLLYFTNLSHSGVPVHPLQFQRYIRNNGVDNDCHVIVYDKGEQLWSSYAFWIFKLYGHERTSILDGGYPLWKSLQEDKMGPYYTELGSNNLSDYIGDFKSRWTSEYISAFDDVISNFDSKEYDIVDAQSLEEYEGSAKGALFGHILGSINIPPEEIFNTVNNTWLNETKMLKIFTEKGLHMSRPIIVYCGTSLHASMIWLGLHRLKFHATIYFGSWPEWVIRAPDYLKVIPENIDNLPSSTENLRTTPEFLNPTNTPKATVLPKKLQ